MNDSENFKHLIDPNKLTELWTIHWEHPTEMDEVIDENEYIFVLNGGQVLSFNNDEPNELRFVLNPNDHEQRGVITFEKITRVFYGPQRSVLVIESKNNDTFSQLMIRPSGKFDIACGMSTKLYETVSWSNMLERNIKIADI